MKYRIMICIAATVICAACDKPFEMDLPLSVAGRHITFSKDGGSTHVLVYSDGNWTAAFDKEVNWAAIDRTSGRGNGELVFSYAANYGIARQVGIVLSKGEIRDTVFMLQNGPVTSPSFRFAGTSLPLIKAGGLVHARATSNLLYSADALTVTAIYTASDGSRDTVLVTSVDKNPSHWINSAITKWDGLDLEVQDNTSGASRSAQIIMGIDDPTGRSLRSVLNVTQSTAAPKFTFKSMTGTYEKAAATILAEASTNNIWPYSVELTLPDGCDWITNVYLLSSGMYFDLAENTSGKLRSAKISLNYFDSEGNTVKASFTVMQKS